MVARCSRRCGRLAGEGGRVGKGEGVDAGSCGLDGGVGPGIRQTPYMRELGNLSLQKLQ